jgi:16S rRNA (uracil1498-N3)-methyltransferase
MNLILLFPLDFISPNRARLSGRRLKHLQEIIGVKEGQTLTVGLCDGLKGTGKVVYAGEDAVEIETAMLEAPPKPLPVTLILALPRPPVLKRALQCAACFGVKKIILLQFSRVEKSFWNSSALSPQAIEEQLALGLEQAKDTVMPKVFFKKRFKPFVEDELPLIVKGTCAIAAHPLGGHAAPRQVKGPLTLVIGPEGGMVDYEVQKFKELNFKIIDLGPRILKVEYVLPYLIGRMT